MGLQNNLVNLTSRFHNNTNQDTINNLNNPNTFRQSTNQSSILNQSPNHPIQNQNSSSMTMNNQAKKVTSFAENNQSAIQQENPLTRALRKASVSKKEINFGVGGGNQIQSFNSNLRSRQDNQSSQKNYSSGQKQSNQQLQNTNNYKKGTGDISGNSNSGRQSKSKNQIALPINNVSNINHTNFMHSKSMNLDANQLKLQKQKLLAQILEKLSKDVAQNKDFYLKIRKEYDRITIYENMFNRQKEQQKEFKNLKKNLKRLVDHFFLPVFPQQIAKLQHKASNSSKQKIIEQQKKLSRQSMKRKFVRNSKNQINQTAIQNTVTEEEFQPLIYEPEFQQLIEDQTTFFEEDLAVNSLQISILQILNFLEKIVETELYILEGTAIAADQSNMDILTYHGKQIQARAMLNEQITILKYIKIERFYLYVFWTHSEQLSANSHPQIKQRDFIYKRCVGSLKRLRQLIYSLNYLLTDKKRIQLQQCYSNIRNFLMTTFLIMIDNLTNIHQNSKQNMNIQDRGDKERPSYSGMVSSASQSEPKHLMLLKTLYGMADEMMSKNFIEEKKTNQKNMFDKDYIETSKAKEAKTLNFEEMLLNFKDQLQYVDFTEDEFAEYSYIDQDYDKPINTISSNNHLQNIHQRQNQLYQSHTFRDTQISNQNRLRLQSTQIDEDVQDKADGGEEDDGIDGEDFFKNLGFKDPFHKKLLADVQPQEQQNQHYMTQESIEKVQKIIAKNPQFSTVMNNLLNSAYNPFQEGFPFISDTSFKRKFANSMNKKFKTRGALSWIYRDYVHKYKAQNGQNQEHEEDEEDWDQPLDVIELFSFLDSGKSNPLPLMNEINQQGTFTTSHYNQNQRTTMQKFNDNDSVYGDSEKFEKLVNTNFSFKKRYGQDKKIEQKYAEIIYLKKKDRFKNVSSKVTEFFSQQLLAEELKKEQSHNNSQSSQSRLIKAIQRGMQTNIFDMITDDLNPYKKKRAKANQSNGGNNYASFNGRNKSETGGSSQYWRRFSSSHEQSIKDSRSFHQQFQSLGSLSQRRRSVTNNFKGIGYGNSRNGGFQPAGTGTFENKFGDQDSEQDYGFFNQINHANSNTSGYFKKRSATIHYRSTIKDIQEEDDLKSKQSDGRNRKQKLGIGFNPGQQSSMHNSSANSKQFFNKASKRMAQLRKPSSGVFLNNDYLY
ncbi:UNKNOWN [Stylonychia lemnae]|uniref:Uncharacterized protein n=1 Tax=Stylonychia lemnae TaxID=5949 RepID=A0A078A1Y5_STYLE|nr:UNKNOWN [Stylonychia lemnae]|eukprot:CDW75493.1 UNKNOWN [Stylonychia lemnae]